MGRRKSKAKRHKHAKRTAPAQIKSKARSPSSKRKRLAPRRPAAVSRKKTAARSPTRLRPSPLIEAAVRDVNRGRSLTATARSLKLSPKDLQSHLRQRGLLRRKGKRWVFADKRLRRVLVITGGRIRKVIVSGYESASLAGKHYHAAGAFVRSNDVSVIEPFRGLSVTASNGSRYVLETDPNALHRIAATDTPPFHEIYEPPSSG